jgi:hypothetical protein
VAKKQVSVEETAAAALAACLTDPTPRPLKGTKAKPGVFIGASVAVKNAIELCLDNRLVEATGEFQGKGKNAKELFRITPQGVEFALKHSQDATLLGNLVDAADSQTQRISGIFTELEATANRLDAQRDLLNQLLKRVVPPDLSAVLASQSKAAVVRQAEPSAAQANSNTRANPNAQTAAWLAKAVDVVQAHKTQTRSFCPLHVLYSKLNPQYEISLGQFHDGLRELVKQKRIILQPWTGPMYQLERDECALLMGQEIKFYADLTN